MALCLSACKYSNEDDEPTTYTVTVASTIENGSVTASSTSATAGTEITLTATPNSGYQFSAFSVTDASGNAITVTDSKFTMPASNVTVSATFTKTLNQPVAVTGISLDKTTAQTVNVGESISFTATVAPDNATDKTVKWSVSGTGVTLYSDSACSTAITTDTAISTLTVYAKGTAAGNATVTVTSNADSTKTASCAVTVPVTLRAALVNGATLEVKCKSSNDVEMGGNFTYNDGVFTRNNFVGEEMVFRVMKATATVSGTTITFNTGFTTNDNYNHDVTFNTTDNTYTLTGTLTGESLKGSVVSVKVNGTEILSQLTAQ